MDKIIIQDWHIHTEASYDATLSFEELVRKATQKKLNGFGVTEHVNMPYMINHLKTSREMFEKYAPKEMHFGVELSVASLLWHEYCEKNISDPEAGSVAGIVPELIIPGFGGADPSLVKKGTEKSKPYSLAMDENQLRENKVEYVVAAAHWSLIGEADRKSMIYHWHDQQMYCATDKRVDIVGHPWWCPWFLGWEARYWRRCKIIGEPWFDDFNVIEKSLHDEFAAALIENDKCAELNASFFQSALYSDRFKNQYAEYIRMLFEKGVKISLGTDSHDTYGDFDESEHYLQSVGFNSSDFVAPNLRKYE